MDYKGRAITTNDQFCQKTLYKVVEDEEYEDDFISDHSEDSFETFIKSKNKKSLSFLSTKSPSSNFEKQHQYETNKAEILDDFNGLFSKTDEKVPFKNVEEKPKKNSFKVLLDDTPSGGISSRKNLTSLSYDTQHGEMTRNFHLDYPKQKFTNDKNSSENNSLPYNELEPRIFQKKQKNKEFCNQFSTNKSITILQKYDKKKSNPLLKLLEDDPASSSDFEIGKGPTLSKECLSIKCNEFQDKDPDLFSVDEDLSFLKSKHLLNKSYLNQLKIKTSELSNHEEEFLPDYKCQNFENSSNNKSNYIDCLLEEPTETANTNEFPLAPIPKPRTYDGANRIHSHVQTSKRSTDKNLFRSTANAELSHDDFISSLPSFKSKDSEISSKTKEKFQHKLSNRKIKKTYSEEENQKANQNKQSETLTTEFNQNVGSENLLALFEQVNIPEKTFLQKPKEKPENCIEKVASVMEPSEALARKLIKQNDKRKTSHHLAFNIIENVALHNNTRTMIGEYTDKEEMEKTSKPAKSVKKLKSFRKPAANYAGLGSLTGLKQLRQFEMKIEEADLISSVDLKSLAYMQWLADREKKLKEQKKLKLEEEEKENEKRINEKKEKLYSNETARKVWLEKKSNLMEEEETRRRIKKKAKKEEKLKREEEKLKSAKRAEVARERLLIEARKQHRLEQKRKKEEELIKAQKEEDKKREVKRAVDKWNEERNKRWENDRKREMQDRKKKERARTEFKVEKHEKAKNNFLKWQKKKEPYHHVTYLNFYDEDRPLWCPS